MLRHLEAKGIVTHRRVGKRFIFRPTTTSATAERSAVRHLVRTFFGGSRLRAVAALLDLPAEGIDQIELARLRKLIQSAKARGR